MYQDIIITPITLSVEELEEMLQQAKKANEKEVTLFIYLEKERWGEITLQ